LLSEVALPSPREARGWVAELRAMMRSFVSARERHPCTADLMQSRPDLSRNARRATEATLDLLRRAGFQPADAVRVVQQLSTLLTSRAGIAVADPAAEDAARVAWAALPPAQYPRMREAAAHLSAWDDPARDREFGVELLLLGVQGLLRRQRRAARNGRRAPIRAGGRGRAGKARP
jgi:hypothetical protein